MTSEYALRCILCATSYEVEASNVEELSAAKSEAPVYMCPTCQAKVQYESEQKFK